ncbi:MAG: porphobilinogen synthase, partial [Verrucomicrobiota bacterium]
MAPYRVPDNHRLHPLYATDELRREQAEGMVEKDQLVFPIFITDQPGAKEIIGAMPGQFRWGPDRIAEAIEPLVNDGLRAVLIFGVPTRDKDGMGSTADDENTPAIQAVRALRSAFPEIDVMTDVCMCAYTDHGHCGILQDDGSIN